jgi:hypothetical protein
MCARRPTRAIGFELSMPECPGPEDYLGKLLTL